MGNCVPSKRKPSHGVVGNPIHDDEAPPTDHTKGAETQLAPAAATTKKKKKKSKKNQEVAMSHDDHHVSTTITHDYRHVDHIVVHERHHVANEDDVIKEKLKALESEENERRIKIEQLINELDQTRKTVLDYQQEQIRLKETIVELEVTAQRASQISIESLRGDGQYDVSTTVDAAEPEGSVADDNVDNMSVMTNTIEDRSQMEFLDSTLSRVTSELAASQMLISQYENERQQFMQELSSYQEDVKAITDNLQSDLKLMTLRAEVAERQLNSVDQRT